VRDRKSGEYIYVTKWKGYESKDNTSEPEAHLITCSSLLAYWKNKSKGKKPSKAQQEQVARVTKLQEAALRERHDATARRRTQPLQREPHPAPVPPAGAPCSARRPHVAMLPRAATRCHILLLLLHYCYYYFYYYY